MGLSYNTYLNSNRIYGCQKCKTHLANHDEIVSRVRTAPHLPFSASIHSPPLSPHRDPPFLIPPASIY